MPIIIIIIITILMCIISLFIYCGNYGYHVIIHLY